MSRRWNRIRNRGILSMSIGIDSCDVGCISFRDNRSSSIVRDYIFNCWVRCRGNNSRTIGRDVSGCWKKCRGNSSSCGCWNRRRVNMNRSIYRDTSGRIFRDNICCCRCQ